MNEKDNEMWKNFLLVYQFGVSRIKTSLDILNMEYSNIYDYNPIEHIKSRIKSPKDIVLKLKKLDLKPTMENAKKYIYDIGGVRIICAFEDDVYYLHQTLERQTDIEIIKIKDYIKEPKPNGYRSLHIIVKLPVYLSEKVEYVFVEIQIRTIVMDFWASLEHKLYYKKNINVPNEIISGLKDCASISAILDEKMLGMKKQINILSKKTGTN